MEQINDLYLSISTLAMAVLPITGWIKTHLFSNIKTQNLSWFVAIGLAYIGYALKLEMFANFGAITTGLYGLAAGFTANGLANTTIVNSILVAIQARIPSRK